MAEHHLVESKDRWERESEYFDGHEYTAEPISPVVIDRYRNCKRPYLAAEYPYWRLGDVRGKRILDVGCGDGTNAVIMALKGANVVGIDLSGRAIECARQRALLHELEDRTRFVCGPIETALQSEAGFDIITGFAVLHHLLPVLGKFLTEVKRHGHHDTQYVFVEPVNLSPGLRRLRLALPISVSGTPDERPLEQAELDVIGRHFRRLDIAYFHAAARLADRFLLRNRGYETASWWRKSTYRTASQVDALLLGRLGFRQLSSIAVVSAWTSPRPDAYTDR